MLALKKISATKLAIYIAIIVLMFGGTGYMIYLNQKFSSQKPLNIENPGQYNYISGPDTTASAPAASGEQGAIKSPASNNISREAKNGGAEIDIFSSEKFKALRENILIHQGQPSAGKRNPFQPD